MYRKIKSFTPDSSWDVVFEDGTVRPMAGWAHIENYSEEGEWLEDRDEFVGMFLHFDETPYLIDLHTYLEDEDPLYGDIAKYQRHSLTQRIPDAGESVAS